MRKVAQTCREKHVWLCLKATHTLSRASFLPQAISAIGLSIISWLSKPPVLLQGCTVPAGQGSQLKGWLPTECAAPQGAEELLPAPWWLLPTSLGLQQLLQRSCSAATSATPHPGRFAPGQESHTSTEDMGTKASPRAPHAPCPALCGAGAGAAPSQLEG